MSGPRDEGSALSPVRAVERACMLMSAFSLQEPALTLGELAERVGLPKPTAYRIASSLVQSGFMTQSEDGRYALGTKLMELGAIVREHLDLVQICGPVLQALASATGETVLLGQPDWATAEIVVVARRDSAHALSILSPVGRRSPIAPGSLGQALLSGMAPGERQAFVRRLGTTTDAGGRRRTPAAFLRELEEAAARGYALVEDGYLEGVSGVAVPVLNEGARPLGTIGIVGPSTRLHDRLDQFGALLVRETAAL
jgi:DNA-binding IclR family transcriptional regulator